MTHSSSKKSIPLNGNPVSAPERSLEVCGGMVILNIGHITSWDWELYVITTYGRSKSGAVCGFANI